MKFKLITLLSLVILITLFSSSCKVATSPDGTGSIATAEESNDSIEVKQTKYRGSKVTEWEVRYRKLADGTKIREGISKRYLQTGKLAETVNYVYGKKEGLRTYFYQEGTVWKEIEYAKGRRNGSFKKFDRKGNLDAQMEYKNGYPGVGLKEFYDSGKEKEDPRLVLNESNKIKENGNYIITASLLGDGVKRIKRVEFYETRLLDGKYFNERSKKMVLLTKLSAHKGELKIPVRRGEFVDNTVNIVAVITTKTGLKLILQKSVHVGVRGV